MKLYEVFIGGRWLEIKAEDAFRAVWIATDEGKLVRQARCRRKGSRYQGRLYKVRGSMVGY